VREVREAAREGQMHCWRYYDYNVPVPLINMPACSIVVVYIGA